MKLFSNGMRESEQSDVTVHINCSEEEAFMKLLNFIYCGTLVNSTTMAVILDVLKVADKFEVPSCICQCEAMLQSMTMTLEAASLLLSLPSCVQMIDVVQQLVKDTKGFLRDHFSQMKFDEEYMQLPLVVLEEVLASDKLRILSEDNLFDLVMNWAIKHYPNEAERAEVLKTKLFKLIRFPQMSYKKLEALLFDKGIGKILSDLIMDAILFKAEPSRSHKRKSYAFNDRNKRFGRSYMFRPITVLKFDTPGREYRVFWDIKKDQFSTIHYSRDRRDLQYSEAFCLRDHAFRLVAHYLDHEEAIQFSIQLVGQLINTLNLILDCSFSVRSKPSNTFSEIFQGQIIADKGNPGDFFHAFGVKRSISVVDNAPHVINSVIHLQAVFMLR